MSDRDLEEACWRAHDTAQDNEDLPNCLKALDLLVKIRLAGDRVKGDAEKAAPKASDEVARATAELNGGDR